MNKSTDSTVADLGNTTTKSSVKQDSARKRWCFTFNNYTKEEYSKLVEQFSTNGALFSIGEEVGESGTPHLQGYVELRFRKRFKYMKDIIPRGHIEPCKGSRRDNIDYTQKDKKFLQNFVEVVHTEPVPDCLDVVKDLMDSYSFPKGDRKINVVVDTTGGKGKTEFCRWCCLNYKDIIITGGKAENMKNQIVEYFKTNNRYPKYILMDIPRSSLGFISYQGIEEVKNMLFYSGKYEGGMVVGNKPFICMFMNDLPKFENMSDDRWNVIDLDNP